MKFAFVVADLPLPVGGRSLPGARFHFHKDEGVIVPANNVDLAAAVTAKVSEKNFATVTLQITAC